MFSRTIAESQSSVILQKLQHQNFTRIFQRKLRSRANSYGIEISLEYLKVNSGRGQAGSMEIKVWKLVRKCVEFYCHSPPWKGFPYHRSSVTMNITLEYSCLDFSTFSTSEACILRLDAISLSCSVPYHGSHSQLRCILLENAIWSQLPFPFLPRSSIFLNNVATRHITSFSPTSRLLTRDHMCTTMTDIASFCPIFMLLSRDIKIAVFDTASLSLSFGPYSKDHVNSLRMRLPESAFSSYHRLRFT